MVPRARLGTSHPIATRGPVTTTGGEFPRHIGRRTAGREDQQQTHRADTEAEPLETAAQGEAVGDWVERRVSLAEHRRPLGAWAKLGRSWEPFKVAGYQTHVRTQVINGEIVSQQSTGIAVKLKVA
jgi:hypothetical protein